jgi:YfiH family protein
MRAFVLASYPSSLSDPTNQSVARVTIVFVPKTGFKTGQIPAGQRSDYWCWSDHKGLSEVRFVGRGPEASRQEILDAVSGFETRLELSRLQQIHSSSVVQAVAGHAGLGDALIATTSRLALSIATADCVPVLLSSGSQTAAVHAGWRGIASDIVPRAARLIESPGSETTAWIGPSIGPCCYEVSSEVASEVLGGQHFHCTSSASTNRPHLDLGRVVIEQLRAANVYDSRHIPTCTKCHPERLWSYRGEARKPAGRNLAFIWRNP